MRCHPIKLCAFVFVFALYGGFSALSASPCQIKPKTQAQEPVYLNPHPNENLAEARKGTEYHTVVQARHPNSSTQVNNMQNLKCPGFVPNGVGIDKVVVEEIEGLPPGVEYACDEPNCNYKGGSAACMVVQGKPQKRGTYDLVVHLTGTSTIAGFDKESQCRLKGYTIEVK